MENVIYIANDCIRVIHGEFKKEAFKINYFEAFPLPDECMVNGVIADELVLHKALEKLQSANIKNARLVISSSNILFKNVKVPKLSKKQLLEFTKEELLTVKEEGDEKEYVYDYGVLNDQVDKGGEILCCSVEKNLIASYVDAFNKVGIKLLSIDVAIYAMCKLTSKIPMLEGKNYILSMIDGNNLVTLLFVNNQYAFTNRTRLFADRDTEAIVSEIARTISQVIQFSKSQLHDVVFDELFITGIKENEKAVYTQVKNLFNSEARAFPALDCITVLGMANKNEISDYLYCVGTLVRK